MAQRHGRRRSVALRLLAATAVLLGMAPAAPGPVLADDGPIAARALDPALADEAALLEQRIADNLWYGQVFRATFASTERNPGEVVALGEFGDSGLWSSVYLASESYRYAVLQHEIETAANHGQRVSAEVHQRQVKARIDELADAVHLRVNIASSWKADGGTSPTGRGYADGLVDGEPGMLFRNCLPAGFALQDQDPATRGENYFGPLRWTGKPLAIDPDGEHADWYCEDDTSRDSYIGTVFGLLAAFDLVGPHDPALQAQIRDDVLAMVGYLWRHGWSVVYPYQRNDPDDELSFNNGVVPLFVQTPQARLRMTQAARHVAAVAGTPAEAATWEAIWTEELAVMGPNYLNDALLAVQSPDSAYYGFNLNYLNSFDLIRLEANPATRELFRTGLSIVDATAGDDLNAHFETITFALTGDTDKRDAAEQHLREWIDWEASNYGPVVNSTRCGVDLTCIPEDEVRVVQPSPAGPVTVTEPGSSSRLRATTPLPIAQRVPTDFLWQRSPFRLDGWASPRELEPGIDFLMPYWMLRYVSEVAPPASAPLTPWAGMHTE